MSDLEKVLAAGARIIAGCQASRDDIAAGRVVSFDALLTGLEQGLHDVKANAGVKP